MKCTPIWAVLCPASPAWLKAHRDALMDLEEDLPPMHVQVLAGTR